MNHAAITHLFKNFYRSDVLFIVLSNNVHAQKRDHGKEDPAKPDRQSLSQNSLWSHWKQFRRKQFRMFQLQLDTADSTSTLRQTELLMTPSMNPVDAATGDTSFTSRRQRQRTQPTFDNEREQRGQTSTPPCILRVSPSTNRAVVYGGQGNCLVEQ